MSIYTLEEIRNIILPVAKEYQIETVYLFGSYARGDANETSDIDLLIKGFKSDKPFAYPGLYVDLEERFNKKVDIVTVESLNDNRMESRLTKRFKFNLKKERITLYESQ